MKKQVFERKNDSLNEYLAQLDELLKRNKGGGLYEGFDVNPRAFRLPGRVVDPSGLGQDAMKDDLKYSAYEPGVIPMEARQSRLDFIPQFDFEEMRQTTLERRNPADDFNDPRYQEALSRPVETTTEDLEQVYKETGKAYGVQQLIDGGILYNDGLIRYDDGTVREYTGQEAEAIASMEDGSVRYSDGSFRRPASQQEMNVQTGEPAYPIASNADGTVLYSDGISRAFDPSVGEFKKADSGVINFFDTFGQGYRFQPQGANDLIGQCAWFSQQITTLPDGSSWRIGNTLEQKQAYLQNYMAGGLAYMPGEQEAKTGQSIVFDEGTRWGHVATISEIFRGADGQLYYRLTESNYAAPNTVTHDRVVSANDPKILGIVKTTPRQGYDRVSYEQAPDISGERALAVQENASQTGEQERQGEDAPEDQEVQAAPMSQVTPEQQRELQPQQRDRYLGQTINEGIIQPIAQAPQQFAEAIQPMSPERQALAQVPEQLAQKVGVQAEFGLSEGIAGQDPMQARISALSRQPKEYNPYRQLLGNITERVGDRLGIPEGSFSETIAGGPTKRTNQALASQIGGEKPESVPGIRQNILDIGQDIGNRASQVVNPVLSKAGEGIEALKDKASNLFQKTPLMGLFEGQKQVGDTKGSTMIDTSGGREQGDNRDAFFKFGGADQYANYLIDNAEQQKGGALDTSLFKSDFFKDPNRIANVFGETFMGKSATDKYRDYLGEQVKPGFDEPYRTERRQEGDTLYEYKIPIEQYFQNQYFKNLISETPDVLKSGFSYDQFQLPTVTKSASEFKGETPVDSRFSPIFKSGAVDLFKRAGSKVGQLAGDIFKKPAPVYQGATPSMSYEIPQAQRSIFSAPAPMSVSIPSTQRTAISTVPKVSSGGSSGSSGSGSSRSSAPSSPNLASITPSVASRATAIQRAEQKQGGIKVGSGVVSTAPVKESSSSAQIKRSPSKSIFASAASWLKNLFRRR
jgi:hypothetical protein